MVSVQLQQFSAYGIRSVIEIILSIIYNRSSIPNYATNAYIMARNNSGYSGHQRIPFTFPAFLVLTQPSPRASALVWPKLHLAMLAPRPNTLTLPSCLALYYTADRPHVPLRRSVTPLGPPASQAHYTVPLTVLYPSQVTTLGPLRALTMAMYARTIKPRPRYCPQVTCTTTHSVSSIFNFLAMGLSDITTYT